MLRSRACLPSQRLAGKPQRKLRDIPVLSLRPLIPGTRAVQATRVFLGLRPCNGSLHSFLAAPRLARSPNQPLYSNFSTTSVVRSSQAITSRSASAEAFASLGVQTPEVGTDSRLSQADATQGDTTLSPLAQRVAASVRQGSSASSIIATIESAISADSTVPPDAIECAIDEYITGGNNFAFAREIFEWARRQRALQPSIADIEAHLYEKLVESHSLLGVVALKDQLAKGGTLASYRTAFAQLNATPNSRSFQTQCTSALESMLSGFFAGKVIEKSLDSEGLDSTLLEAARIAINIASTHHLAALISLLHTLANKGDDEILQLVYVLQLRHVKSSLPAGQSFGAGLKVLAHLHSLGLKPKSLVLANLVLCCSSEAEYNQALEAVTSAGVDATTSAAIIVATVYYRLVTTNDIDKANLEVTKLLKASIQGDGAKLIEQIGVELLTSTLPIHRTFGLRLLRFYLDPWNLEVSKERKRKFASQLQALFTKPSGKNPPKFSFDTTEIAWHLKLLAEMQSDKTPS